ncbi:hypothetical protein [Tolypothrix sp. VBCCA 56010]
MYENRKAIARRSSYKGDACGGLRQRTSCMYENRKAIALIPAQNVGV